MILTFDEIIANAQKNYKPTPKVEFIDNTPNYARIESIATPIGLAIATILMVYCIIF